jgi:hypothetical protein
MLLLFPPTMLSCLPQGWKQNLEQKYYVPENISGFVPHSCYFCPEYPVQSVPAFQYHAHGDENDRVDVHARGDDQAVHSHKLHT